MNTTTFTKYAEYKALGQDVRRGFYKKQDGKVYVEIHQH